MSDPRAKTIRIEIVYADAYRQMAREVVVDADATVADAVRLSGILDAVPAGSELAAYGIFGHVAAAHARLREGDRIELYRPLKIDPKQARRRRADRQKK